MKKITEKHIENFKSYLQNEERAAATMEKYIRDIHTFNAWLGGREIGKNAVLAYKEYLIETYAPASVNSVLSSLNSFFRFVGWHDCHVKTLKIQRQIFAKSERELTKAEYERLLNAAQKKGNRRLYYLMQTICNTGIRISELRFIDANAVKTGRAAIRCKGKMRVVILTAPLCKMLKGYMKEQGITSGSVFQTRTGKPLNRSNVWRMLKALCESAGVSKDKVFPHNFRHLFARTFYSLQKDVVRLADILGHSSINTTRIYTMESGAVHLKQMQKLGLLRC